MKAKIILGITLMSFAIGLAQQSKSDAIALEKDVLARSKTYGDLSVTVNSLYNLIALEGENSTYKDSLALLYYSGRKFTQSFMVANEVLKRDPKHDGMLEIKAISLEALGAIDKALESYQELFKVTKSNYHGYTIAKLQYNMKKFDDAYASITAAEKLNDSGKIKVTYNVNQSHSQQVDLLAAIAYLKGLIAIELDKKDEAKKSLEKAVKIEPDFVFAKERLEKL